MRTRPPSRLCRLRRTAVCGDGREGIAGGRAGGGPRVDNFCSGRLCHDWNWRAVSDTVRQSLPLPHVVVRERTVEASGRLGEFVRRQAQPAGGRRDHLRRDVAAAALATHVVERVADGVHVEGFRGEVLLGLFLHGLSVC